MPVGELEAAAAAAWADGLGCDPRLLAEPGAHLVTGGAELRELHGVYIAGVGAAVLVFCPAGLRSRVATVLSSTLPGEMFTPATCAAIAGIDTAQVLGPSWHGFTDAAHFTPVGPAAGRRLDHGDPLLAELREACGEEDWAEGGFAHPDGLIYGIEADGRLAAAGNLTSFRGYPACSSTGTGAAAASAQR